MPYLPDITDPDLIDRADFTFDEKQATQAARNRLRAMGVVESGVGIFSKSYGMTADEAARYDAALSVPNIFRESGVTLSNAGSSIIDGAGRAGVALGGIWDGLNKTLIIVSVLVGVLTLHSLLRKK